MGGSLRKAGSHVIRVEQNCRTRNAAEFHSIQEDEAVEAFIRHLADPTLRGRASNDYVTPTSEVRSPKSEGSPVVKMRSTVAKCFASAFGSRASFGLRTSDFGLQLLRQPDAEPIIPIRHVAEAHQADAALEELLELFAEVGHQISSPSFLICS
jgi:hypothetical protein